MQTTDLPMWIQLKPMTKTHKSAGGLSTGNTPDPIIALPPLNDADQIDLHSWRTILFWPLVFCDGQAAVPDEPWTEIHDRLDHIDKIGGKEDQTDRARDEAEAFAEFVYFHEYVQTALFGRPGGRAGPGDLRVFRRDDISTVDVRIDGDGLGPRTVELRVDRLRLYRPGKGLAILVVEVSASDTPCVTPQSGKIRRMKLADALTLGDVFRRAYPGFFSREDQTPGLSPTRVTWGGRQSAEQMTPSQAIGHVRSHRKPPVFHHWLQVLPENMLAKDAEPPRLADGWRQIVDERMPNMTFVSFADTTTVGRLSDHLKSRLAAVDSFGRGPAYSNAQIKRDLEVQTYDRFEHLGTLYFVSGYGFTVVVSGKDYEEHLIPHFRGHYFQMGLLLQIEVAMGLLLSNRISRAIAEPGATSASKADALRNAQEDLLDLTHRFRFTGVSNHVQGRELFDLWRRQLGNASLFSDLKQELEAGSDFLRSEKQQHDAQVATRFTLLGASFGLLSLAGMIRPPDGIAATTATQIIEWRHFLIYVALGLGVAVMSSLVVEVVHRRWFVRWPMPRWLPWVAGILAGGLVGVIGWFGLLRLFGP